jgi:hypothetical protein
VKFVEEQLLSAFRDTPAETDCSVSVKVLEMIGCKEHGQQERWLTQHRAPHEGKAWHMTGERWEYTAHPDVSVSLQESLPLSPHMPAPRPKRSHSPINPRATPAIVVPPVVPLKRGV